MSLLKLIGKFLFLIFTLGLLLLYALGLTDKFENPASKNLDIKGYVFVGIILLGFVFLNLIFLNIINIKRKE